MTKSWLFDQCLETVQLTLDVWRGAKVCTFPQDTICDALALDGWKILLAKFRSSPQIIT